MVKKSTLFVLICAAVLAGVVYYLEKKSGNEAKSSKDTSKPAYSVAASDIVSFRIAHTAQPDRPEVRFAKRKGVWQIMQPIETEADQSTAQGIVDQLASARVSETETGAADRRKVYGLDPPQLSVGFRIHNGAKHTLLIGDKDFSGDSVYTIVDGSKDVSLLPMSLSTSVGKSLDDLRDRNVLDIESGQVASFILRNEGGELEAARERGQWKFSKPRDVLGDDDSVDSLLSAVATAKMSVIVSEKPENPSKYGLATPAVTFTAVDSKGKKSTLLVGKKKDDTYFARDASRPMIFRISQDLYTKLAQRFTDLRDKQVVHLLADDIQRIQIQNGATSIVLSRKKDSPDQWQIDAPEVQKQEQKGKSVASWKLLDPITNLRAEEVIDHPPASLLAKLAKPAITVVLTGKNGKEITVRISKQSGDFAYAQASGSAALYKLKKQVLGDLNIKPGDLIS
jgi:hypothetical protein